MTYREDESRIREKHLRENFAWLNRFTLSLLKQHPGRGSLVMKRRKCGWSRSSCWKLLLGQWFSGSSPKRVGKKPCVRAAKTFVSRIFWLLLGAENLA